MKLYRPPSEDRFKPYVDKVAREPARRPTASALRVKTLDKWSIPWLRKVDQTVRSEQPEFKRDGVFRFLDLPRELRDEIYDQLLLLPCEWLPSTMVDTGDERRIFAESKLDHKKKNMSNLEDSSGSMDADPWGREIEDRRATPVGAIHIFGIPFPASNPALGLALVNRQINTEIFERAHKFMQPIACTSDLSRPLRIASELLYDFAWARPMPLGLPPPAIPIQYVELALDLNPLQPALWLIGGIDAAGFIYRCLGDFLIAILSNGAALDPNVNRRARKPQAGEQPRHSIAEAAVSIRMHPAGKYESKDSLDRAGSLLAVDLHYALDDFFQRVARGNDDADQVHGEYIASHVGKVTSYVNGVRHAIELDGESLAEFDFANLFISYEDATPYQRGSEPWPTEAKEMKARIAASRKQKGFHVPPGKYNDMQIDE